METEGRRIFKRDMATFYGMTVLFAMFLGLFAFGIVRGDTWWQVLKNSIFILFAAWWFIDRQYRRYFSYRHLEFSDPDLIVTRRTGTELYTLPESLLKVGKELSNLVLTFKNGNNEFVLYTDTLKEKAAFMANLNFPMPAGLKEGENGVSAGTVRDYFAAVQPSRLREFVYLALGGLFALIIFLLLLSQFINLRQLLV